LIKVVPNAIGPLSVLSCLSIYNVGVLWPKTAGWIKAPLGTEGGLLPGHGVIEGDPAPHYEKGHSSSPLFGPCLLWPNGRPSQQLLSSCRLMIPLFYNLTTRLLVSTVYF